MTSRINNQLMKDLRYQCKSLDFIQGLWETQLQQAPEMVTFLNFRKVTVGGMRKMDEGAGFGWETAERLMKQFQAR